MASLTAQILERIRPFCSEMPEAELCALARTMAMIQHKYDLLDLWGAPPLSRRNVT